MQFQLPSSCCLIIVRLAMLLSISVGNAVAAADDLADRTGWKTINTVRLTIEVENTEKPGQFQATSPSATFHDGQRFRLSLTSDADLYIYVLVRNADNSLAVLEPENPGAIAKLKAKKQLRVPAAETFQFAPPAGKERLRVIACPFPLPWVEADQLFQVRAGDVLNSQEADALAQLKALTPPEIPKVLKHAAELKSAKSVREATQAIDSGTMSRGARVLIVEEFRHELALSLTSPNASDRAVLVHDIELNHK